MTQSEQLNKSVSAMRRALAHKRAARKIQTNTQLVAHEVVSNALAASENPLLEQSFRAYAVLERLDALEGQAQSSAFAHSVLDIDLTLAPESEELAAFGQALQSEA